MKLKSACKYLWVMSLITLHKGLFRTMVHNCTGKKRGEAINSLKPGAKNTAYNSGGEEGLSLRLQGPKSNPWYHNHNNPELNSALNGGGEACKMVVQMT